MCFAKYYFLADFNLCIFILLFKIYRLKISKINYNENTNDKIWPKNYVVFNKIRKFQLNTIYSHVNLDRS